MKIIVYTAIFGEIDQLWTPLPIAMAGVKHVYFTDKKKVEMGCWGQRGNRFEIVSGKSKALHPLWEQRIVPAQFGNRRTARYYKALPHEHLPNADVTIWLDCNVRLLISAPNAVKRWLGANASLATFNHPDRNCLYTEAAFCMKKGKGNKARLTAQVKAYRRVGMPIGWGLAESRCVIRRNVEAVRKLNEMWWAEISQFSVRDQISFPYCCWKLGLKWKVIPGRVGPSSLRGLNKAFWFARHTKGK